MKETGQKLANGVKESVEDFMSGFAGHGWKLWEYIKGKWMLEIDAIRVRGQFTIFELLVSKIRAIIGAQTITQGCGKIKTVGISEDGAAYLITLEDTDMSFMEHDFIRCQEFTGNQRLYHVEIESIVDGVIHIPVSEFESEVNEDGITFVTNPPMPGDDIVQFGNSSYEEQYAGRHSAIYMHADESGQPAIDVLDGIYTKDWSNCLKVRMGGDIPGTAGLKGFYCVNGMLKAVDEDGTILYQFNPDSSGFIAKGNIRWDKDGNGDIFNRAIYWDKGGFHFGSGVKLTWDNLDSETKENLKGEPGRDGNNGADGINGEDGTSLVYKGEFTSHPSNPQNGWYYRNISDKKTYVYQDNAWYVMTVDGSDGKDGLDGINGEDGKDGLDIVWKGDSSIPPANPQKNWVYRDTDNGRVYIYNGTAWALMVADGNDGIDGTDGKDGMRVYITYHDSEAEPAKPTGRGTSDGWHTDATNAVVWISQKVSESADSGEWGDPIRVKGEPGKDGQDANLLPWIEKWNGYATELGEEYIVTPKMFSGIKSSDGNLTGIVQGKECLTDKTTGEKRTGIFAVVDGEIVFELDPINKKYKFKGRVEVEEGSLSLANGKIVLREDGTGVLADNSIYWDEYGYLYQRSRPRVIWRSAVHEMDELGIHGRNPYNIDLRKGTYIETLTAYVGEPRYINLPNPSDVPGAILDINCRLGTRSFDVIGFKCQSASFMQTKSGSISAHSFVCLSPGSQGTITAVSTNDDSYWDISESFIDKE